MQVISFFLLLSSMLLYGHTSVWLSYHLLIGLWAFPVVGVYVCVRVCVCMFTSIWTYIVFSSKFLEVEFLGHVVNT